MEWGLRIVYESVTTRNLRKGAKHMPLMKTVSMWRCRCGISIKVIGETDGTKPVIPVLAACPKCDFQQAIYIDRIISLENDTANTIDPKRPTD